jgi:hypothetical protein
MPIAAPGVQHPTGVIADAVGVDVCSSLEGLTHLEIANPDPRERERQDLGGREAPGAVLQPQTDHPAGRLRPRPVLEHVNAQGSLAVLLDAEGLAEFGSEEVPRRPRVSRAHHDGLGEAHPSGATSNRVPLKSSVTDEAMPSSAANDRAAPIARSQLA